jgi:hypothetical protein
MKGDQMKVILSVLLLIIALHTADLFARAPETLQEARVLAANQGKPVLMEFLRSG